MPSHFRSFFVRRVSSYPRLILWRIAQPFGRLGQRARDYFTKTKPRRRISRIVGIVLFGCMTVACMGNYGCNGCLGFTAILGAPYDLDVTAPNHLYGYPKGSYYTGSAARQLLRQELFSSLSPTKAMLYLEKGNPARAVSRSLNARRREHRTSALSPNSVTTGDTSGTLRPGSPSASWFGSYTTDGLGLPPPAKVRAVGASSIHDVVRHELEMPSVGHIDLYIRVVDAQGNCASVICPIGSSGHASAKVA